MSRWILVALMALTLGVAPARAQESGSAGTAPDSTGRRADVLLRVDGLACPFCAYGLEKKLTHLEGVDSLEVRLDGGEVLLFLEPGAALTDEALERAVKDAGFSLRAVERPRRARKGG